MQYKTKAKKFLGQNFLQDENIIQKIVQLANINKNDTVLEIGPGLGALTRHLLSKSNDINVVEFDYTIIESLLDNCKTYGEPKVYNEDFLEFNIDKISMPNNKVKLIGNLPYNISTPILFKVISLGDKVIDAHFMLQKEMVDRIISPPNTKVYGRLSVILQYHFTCSYILKIPPEVFYPKPKVDSAIIRLKPRTDKPYLKDYNFFEKLVKLSFAQRRKTLHNNLKEILKQQNIDSRCLPIDTNLRAENLSVNDFVNLANFLSQE
ncbi:16S rRNA (adenine(1518)-N(6)/adenine(1519)-N(6))-dimethyltransferase RsmA [Allofrancisella guangzhouensis]|uniref:Ribosomal RNA small subunit methyltransferase A n=1 Tax=Allofrancisella guangzhouensis TaxID=594679 RepID=A0A0A8E566_9GAMM|nr:16S rRNA (adenine(1518)-N(6)/adenine(1519)-N(6))-dimethyltransferase RsmA [Allofrancisella guangzhouensis]AJC49385.1 16S rRNA methyltransferase [Allofrancisella guangzhouensis]MBK2026888.1 16S rRNA (adenine(1518)-N(6)/adenine(1519)-N(6))-dimethyltransferase RsmA [Allofrancisella guangzhouensis]MBK2044608.1 16S rRNA (adenine(1518)-N(6)/adenine(1519)-N(6))-dimethyltransferase RsmA [Allofrancisella guangzhouensis]MBK2045380.1 16S rRNA (adenine(1518)-N(6)/adenine(1519)-N(6))-dimethyltransferase 